METRNPISIGAQQAETLGQGHDGDLSETEEGIQELEEEVRQLEQQVNQMAEKIVDYRNTLPAQLKTTLDSILAAQRPVFDTLESQPGSSNSSDVEGHGAALAGEVQKEAENAQLLKQKITSNASAIPIVLNRMKEGMAKIDKLQSSNKAIHPAFKRARTSQ